MTKHTQYKMNKTIRKFSTLKEFIKQNNIDMGYNVQLLFNKFLISDDYNIIYYICSNINKKTNLAYPYNIHIIRNNNKLQCIKEINIGNLCLIQDWFLV